MLRKKRKVVLIIAGLLYVIFGILAFFNIPGAHGEHHHTYPHNLTHIILGVVLLAVTVRCPAFARRFLCYVFAIGYLIIGACGTRAAKDATFTIVPGMVEFHAGDYSVHFATGLFFLVLALLRPSDQPASKQMDIPKARTRCD